MPKRIVIGVGGTGLEVLRCLRRRIVEEHPREGLRSCPEVGFLYIDTDPKEIQASADNKKRWEVLTTSIALQEPEYVTIQAPSIGYILDNLSTYPQIQPWLPVERLKGMNVAARDTPGAQAIRVLGRAIFTLNAEKVQAKFSSLLQSRENQQGEPVVYVACSLSGGTGGGMFLDLAYSLKKWLNGYGRVVGFLVMPDLNEEPRRGVRYIANSYGALMDLNYFSLRSLQHRGQARQVGFRLPSTGDVFHEVPFDYAYLLGVRNQGDIQLSLDALPDMIAHRIYLSWDGAIVRDIESMMNNSATARTQYLTDPFNGNVHAQSFSSFGLASIQYPTEQITEIIAYRLVEGLFNRWKTERPVDNMAERISTAQSSLFLVDEYLLGNKDFFGQNQDYPAISNQVKSDVENEIAALPKDNKAAILRRNQADYFTLFRGGVPAFYRGRVDNLEGAAAVVTRKARDLACRTILDPGMGLPSTIAAVDELIRVATVKRQQYAAYHAGLAPKVKTTGVALDAAFGQLTLAENSLTFKASKTREALQRLSVIMPANRTAIIEQSAYDYGQRLLDKVLSNLGDLRQQLVEAGTAVVRALDKIKVEVESRAAFLEDIQKNTNKFNGSVLFDSNRVQQVLDSVDQGQALTFIQDELLKGGDPLDALAAFRRTESGQPVDENSTDTLDRAYRGAVDWLANHNVVQSTRKNVADQLVDSYPERGGRITAIAMNMRRCKPFVEFALDQMQAYQGQSQFCYTQDGTKDASLVGLMDDDQRRHVNVVQVAQDIQAAGAMPGDIRKISDTNQIIFVSETSAFPLRLLRDVAQLRQRYQTYVAKEGEHALPLLIQREYDPPIGDLFLVPEREKEQFEMAQEAFLLAWSEGWLQVEKDIKENREEIRYRYVESDVSKYESLATDWEAAFAFWMSGEGRALGLWTRAEGQVKQLIGGLQTQRDRGALLGRLYGLLDAMVAAFPNGEQSERYMRWNAIRLRLVRRYKLLREGESVVKVATDIREPNRKSEAPPSTPKAAAPAPTPTATPASPQANVNEDKFLRFVRTAYQSGGGKLSPAMEEMLRVNQRRIGLDDATANRLIDSIFHQSDALTEYRMTLRAFLETGPLTDEALALLVEMRVEQDLGDEDVERVEREERARVAAK